jgi:integrase
LQTRYQLDAIDRAYDAIKEFETLLADARGKMSSNKAFARDLPDETRVVTPEEYKATEHREHHRLVSPWSVLSAKSNVNNESAMKFKSDSAEYMERRIRRLEQIRARGADIECETDHQTPFGRARQINIDAGYNMSLDSNRFGTLVGIVREAMLRADSDIVAIIDGALISPSAASPLARDAAKVNKALARRTPTITEMVKTYIDAGGSRGGLGVRTKGEILQALGSFVEAVGDKQAHVIGKQDVQHFMAQEGSRIVGARTDTGVSRPTSPATITKKVTFLRSAFGMAIDRGTFDGPNPFVGTKLAGYVKAVDKAVMPDKRALNLNELRAIFSHPWFKGCVDRTDRGSLKPGAVRLNDARFWGPVLALYTGCRAAELGGLRLDEVKIDDDHPHLVIKPNDYRRTKSNTSRSVPILDALVNLGLKSYLDEVRASGADRVLPDWNPPFRKLEDGSSEAQWASAKWTKSFNRTILPSVLPHLSGADVRRDVTLHSLRGSFKRLLEDSDMPQQYVDDIIGHAKHDLDRRYSGTRNIDFLSERARRLDHSNLGLTSPI